MRTSISIESLFAYTQKGLRMGLRIRDALRSWTLDELDAVQLILRPTHTRRNTLRYQEDTLAYEVVGRVGQKGASSYSASNYYAKEIKGLTPKNVVGRVGRSYGARGGVQLRRTRLRLRIRKGVLRIRESKTFGLDFKFLAATN